jgi:hypothetical protein
VGDDGTVVVVMSLPVVGKTPARCRHEPSMTTNTTHLRLIGSPCSGYGPPVDVVVWRRCRLLEAGFDEALARRVAGDAMMDVHALLDRVDRGCPPELAVRILAPAESTR